MRRSIATGAVTILTLCLCAAVQAEGPRHVPSPDWRDQVVYFVMLDRFDDGDPSNNDQGAGEYDPASRRHYSGGDLAGVDRRLDYIRGLGATAVWITPPVRHQWWNRRVNYGGYHGYWADDFKQVDPHFGSIADYRRLAAGLHGRGMYLIQDVVVNHVADYLDYGDGWRADDPAAGARLVPDSSGRTAPIQSPFDLNDPRRADHRAAGIYHWTPNILDYGDPVQEKTWQMAGLDDLNTEHPRVRQALRDAYGYWIREVGVDGFRVDTAFYVPPEYFADFLHADDPAAPGILGVARATGRTGFHVFGEGFGIDRPFGDVQARRIEAYARDAQGRALLPSMINFPLYGTTRDVLAGGRPTAELADRIERTMHVHASPHLMPTFLDNHDVDRFLAGGSDEALRQGLLLLMTLPGIPTIYYGTEQGLTGMRDSMFAAGYGSGGRDRFDTTSPGYRYLQRVTALRRGEPVLSRGRPTLMAANAAGPGALVYRMDHEGEALLVALNTASHSVLVDALDAPLPPGSLLRPRFAIDGEAPTFAADAQGQLRLVLPPQAGYVWSIGPAAAPRDTPATPIELDALPARVTGDLRVTGRAHGVPRVRIVLDGNLERAAEATVESDGRFAARVHTGDLIEPEVPHRIVAFDPGTGTVSSAHSFHAEPDWRLTADIDDPTGDDRGPDGRYTYPTDPSWGANRQLDIERVRVFTSAGAMRLDLTMHGLTRSWNPANGFDHVAFTVYVELPDGQGGLRTMPLQQAELPGGMRWHRRLRVGGWSNVLTTPEDAHAGHEGRPLTPGARVTVDEAARTVQLLLPAAALGYPASLQGARVHLTTWDVDSGYRALAPQAGSHSFGGGADHEPRVMDDSGPIRID